VRHSFLAIAVVAIFALGCEVAPKNEGALAQARSAVAQAEADPNVARYAATELDRARKLLMNAEGAPSRTAAHYAYLATQLARIAEQRAHEQVATERIQAGEAERQKILQSTRKAEARLEDLQASQTARGLVLTLNDGSFDTGRAKLSPGAQRSLEQVVSFLEQNPERSVQIEGFTDSDGTNDYNLELSQSRADAVAMVILRRGVDAGRVRAMGYGEMFPVASNTSDGSRQLNRRVEVIVSNDDRAIPARAIPARAMSGSP
jgi:outer membrane protein OmpA-like peptidoglycan-associated protein